MSDQEPHQFPDAHERAQASLLDRYSDELLTSEPAPPDGLDGALAAQARTLRDRGDALVPGDVFAETLRTRLATAQPATPETAPRANRRGGWFRSTRRRLASVAAAVLAIAVLGGVLSQAGQDEVLSGADIIRTAAAAAEAPATQGVTSFEMTVEHWHLPQNLDHTIDLQGDPRTSESHIWHQAPNRWRHESGEGETVVRDGVSFWSTLAAAAQYFVRPQRDFGTPNWLAPGGAVAPSITDEAPVVDCFTPVVTGDDIIAGRPTHVVDLGRSSCPSDPTIGDHVIWVDQETGFVLRRDMYAAADDSVLISSLEVASVRYNDAIDPERFTFTPAPEAELQADPATLTTRAHVTQLDSLAEAEAVATFDVRTPAELPGAFALDRIEHTWPAYLVDQHGRLLDGTSPTDDWLEVRYTRADGAWIEVAEGHSRRHYSWWAVTAEQHRGTADVQGLQGYWVEGVPPAPMYRDEGELTAVLWIDEQRGGSGRHEHRYVALTSNALDVEELIALAESLESGTEAERTS